MEIVGAVVLVDMSSFIVRLVPLIRAREKLAFSVFERSEIRFA
jgi:hypothetical protein